MESQIIDYSRQALLDNDLGLSSTYKNHSIQIIIGCGGIGFWLGILLAMNGFDKFILFDADKIEGSNLNRIPVSPLWVGHNKAVALRKTITMLRPDAKVKTYTFHIKENTLPMLEEVVNGRGTISNAVWDTTDNAVDQQRIYKAVQGKCLYRKIGYEGFDIGAYKNYDVWLDPTTYSPGYRTTRANSVTSALAAGVGLFAGFLDHTEDVNVNLYKLITGKKQRGR